MKIISRILLIVVTSSIFITSCREQSTAERAEEDVSDDIED